MAVILLALQVSCASLSKPMSSSFASVVIRGGTEAQVREETEKVFTGDGWSVRRGAGAEMVFEREGSKWDHIAYGSNVLDTPVINRVRARTVPLADGTLRLQCQAYVVRDSSLNDGDEIKLLGPRAGPYQELLDKVAAHFISLQRQ